MKPSLPEATISEQDGVRYLHLDTPWVQGAMLMKQPRTLVLEYVQRMMAWMLWRPTEQVAQGHAVQLGLGGAAITRFTHQVLRMQTTVVELNPTVIAACRLWFHLPADDERLSVLEADAADWVADTAHLQTVDVLCVDLYDHEAAAPVLDSQAFYADCRRLLTADGCMTVNLFGRSSSYDRSLQRIQAAFGEAAVWAFKPTREGNTVVLALREPVHPVRGELSLRADEIEARWGLPAKKWLRVFKPA